MEKDERRNGGTWQSPGNREPQRASRPAPGKVARTSKLAPGRGVAVQRNVATGGVAPPRARSRRDPTADVWMDAAHRGVTALAERDGQAIQEPVQRKADDSETSQRSGAPEASGPEAPDGGAPAARDGLSPRARAVLKRLGMAPALPPDAAAKLSKGIEIIAAQVSDQPDQDRVADRLSYRIQEDDYQLAFDIRVDAHTGDILVEVGFRDSGNREFLGTFHQQAPSLGAEAPVVRNPEIPEVTRSHSITTLDVARSLFGGSVARDVAAVRPGAVGGAQPDDPENASLEAELARVETELAAAEEELLVLMADAALDVAGIVDPTPISDGLAAVRDLSRGDYVGAGLSAISMIPWLGDAIAKPLKGTRLAKRVLAAKDAIVRLQKKAGQLRKRLKGKPGGGLPSSSRRGGGTSQAPGRNEAFQTKKARSEAETQWREQSSRARAENTVSRADQPLEPMDPDRATHGHGHADHGHQTTDAQQARRVETGKSPSNRKTRKGQHASRFHSPEAEAEALGRARTKLTRDKPSPYDENGLPNRHRVVVETNRRDGFGRRQVARTDASGKTIKPLEAEADATVLKKAMVIFEYVPSKNEWHPVTYYPVQ